MTTPSAAFDTRTVGGTQVVRLPALLRGRTVHPPWPTVADVRRVRSATGPAAVVGPTEHGTYLHARPFVDRLSLARTGEVQVLVLPALDGAALPEPNPSGALRRLMDLGTTEVADFVDEVGDAMSRAAAAPGVASLLGAASHVAEAADRGFLAAVPRLFDGRAARSLIERTLCTSSGDQLHLQSWAPVHGPVIAGLAARLAPPASPPPHPVAGPALRAVPTRQLHITAGNAPVIPLASLLWGWCSRGACVIKLAAEASAVVALLAAALGEVDPSHPLAAATTMAYWRGGDRSVEDVVLAPGAFDRRLVWGSEHTIASVLARGGVTDTIVLRPRVSMSLVGRECLQDPVAAAERAAVDTLAANQAGCTSSLVHLVHGSEGDVQAYCEALVHVLRRWDDVLPQRPPPEAQAVLVALRRGVLAGARWWVNGPWPAVHSAVVHHRGFFDASVHPGSRFVVVTGSPDLQLLLRRVGPEISTVGVAPEPLRREVRDDLAARGVDNVVPLGEAESGYPGRPHDGMLVLPRLVRWVNG